MLFVFEKTSVFIASAFRRKRGRLFVELLHRAAELDGEHDGSRCDGNSVRHGLREIDREHLVGNQRGQEVDERDEQQNFTENGEEQGRFCVAERNERLLAGDLYAEHHR